MTSITENVRSVNRNCRFQLRKETGQLCKLRKESVRANSVKSLENTIFLTLLTELYIVEVYRELRVILNIY